MKTAQKRAMKNQGRGKKKTPSAAAGSARALTLQSTSEGATPTVNEKPTTAAPALTPKTEGDESKKTVPGGATSSEDSPLPIPIHLQVKEVPLSWDPVSEEPITVSSEDEGCDLEALDRIFGICTLHFH